MKHMPILAPSILASDHANLASELAQIEKSGVSWVHIDIMDGHFVPNLSFGPETVRALRKNSKLFFDVHLMLDNPHLFILPFVEAGAQNITIHVEPNYQIENTLKLIKSYGITCGLALNPDTAYQSVLPFIEFVDIVLLMTVQPGFGGQVFQESVLEKIGILAKFRAENSLSYKIQVDGGVNRETGLLSKEKGADIFVMGTAFFKEKDKCSLLCDFS